jgi:DNA end-binding protein Ku
MSRSAWTGIFSFGMVNIPSFLVPTEEAETEIERHGHVFDDMREKNREKRAFKIHQFTQQQHFLKDTGNLKSLPVPQKHVMQVHGFLPLNEINPVCYDKSFMLLPESGATEPLVLLIDALEEKAFVGLGTINLKNKPTMCAVYAKRGFLMVDTLLFPDQLSKESAASHLNKTLKEALETFTENVEEAAREEKPAKSTT